MKDKIIKNLLVNEKSSVKDTMRVIDRGKLGGIAFIVDKTKKFLGIVTDGDIRRAILRGTDIKEPIGKITNKEPIVFKGKFGEKEALALQSNQEIKKKIPDMGSLKIPVVNRKGKVIDVVILYGHKKNIYHRLKKESRQYNEGIKKILITGGAGYFGSVLCRKLLSDGFKVIVLDNLARGDEGIKELFSKRNFKFINGDIRNISDIVEATKGVDAVIHLAAVVGDPACAAGPKETLEINYLATKMLAETCKYFQINRLLFSSSCSVYGANSIPSRQLTEESQLKPISLYAETKIKCENIILDAIDENFSPTILRMATLYGYSPNMRFDLVVNLLTAKAIFDKEITIFGGKQWRPWLHLEDAADACITCLKEPLEKVKGEIFNVLSENYQMIQVGKIINSLIPEAEIKITRKGSDNRDYNVSFEKISTVLNYQPKKKITDGVSHIRKAIKKGIVRKYTAPKYQTTFPKE